MSERISVLASARIFKTPASPSLFASTLPFLQHHYLSLSHNHLSSNLCVLTSIQLPSQLFLTHKHPLQIFYLTTTATSSSPAPPPIASLFLASFISCFCSPPEAENFYSLTSPRPPSSFQQSFTFRRTVLKLTPVFSFSFLSFLELASFFSLLSLFLCHSLLLFSGQSKGNDEANAPHSPENKNTEHSPRRPAALA